MYHFLITKFLIHYDTNLTIDLDICSYHLIQYDNLMINLVLFF